MRIDSVAVNVCKRCGQYAPLCGASVGLWPLVRVHTSRKRVLICRKTDVFRHADNSQMNNPAASCGVVHLANFTFPRGWALIAISGSATLRYLLKRSERVNIPGAQIVHELAITHDQHKQASGIQF